MLRPKYQQYPLLPLRYTTRKIFNKIKRHFVMSLIFYNFWVIDNSDAGARRGRCPPFSPINRLSSIETKRSRTQPTILLCSVIDA